MLWNNNNSPADVYLALFPKNNNKDWMKNLLAATAAVINIFVVVVIVIGLLCLIASDSIYADTAAIAWFTRKDSKDNTYRRTSQPASISTS